MTELVSVPEVPLLPNGERVRLGADGGVRSIVMELASVLAVGPRLPAWSRTPVLGEAPARRRGAKVPSEQPDTVITIVVPLEEAGVNTHPVAVPELVKSAAVSSVIASEKVRV